MLLVPPGGGRVFGYCTVSPGQGPRLMTMKHILSLSATARRRSISRMYVARHAVSCEIDRCPILLTPDSLVLMVIIMVKIRLFVSRHRRGIRKIRHKKRAFIVFCCVTDEIRQRIAQQLELNH